MRTKNIEINKNTTLGEIAEKYPKVSMILANYGLHCIGCHAASWETIEQGAMAHGMNDEEIKQVIKEMNETMKM